LTSHPLCPDEKAAQAATAAAKAATAGPATLQLADDEGEDVDPNQYFERRVQHVAAEKAGGRNPYPHKFAVSHTVPEYVAEFGGLDKGSQLQDKTVSIAGVCSCLSHALKGRTWGAHGAHMLPVAREG